MNSAPNSARKLQRILAALLVVVSLLCSVSTDALASSLVKARVEAEYSNVYQGASTDSALLRKAPQGSMMTIGLTKGDWCYVKYDGTVGYVLKNTLTTDLASDTEGEYAPAPETTPAPTPTVQPTAQPTVQPTKQPQAGVETVTVEATKLYKKPSLEAEFYGSIPANKKVVCLLVNSQWACIEAAGYTGYVPKTAIQLNSDIPVDTPIEPEVPAAPSETEIPESDTKLICYVKGDVYLYPICDTASQPVAALKQGDKILVSAVKNGWAKLCATDGTAGYIPADYVSKNAIAPAVKPVLADWFESNIQEIFGCGTTATVVDVLTGKSFTVRRKGGINHADMETVSKEDTATMLSLYGGVESWDRRAIWVVIDGVYYAASMNGKGHGEETGLDNGLEGHFCIHFLNSRTHGTDNVCPLHQACVKQAYLAKP